MKIQCDVCEKAPATVICCADEAALCKKCDVQVHAANKLARKHPRLSLRSLPHKLPRCDICQCKEKAAFIFCVEDRALFCKDCDEAIHSANNLAKNHQRYLAAGICVELSSKRDMGSSKNQFMPRPPKSNPPPMSSKIPTQHVSDPASPAWAVDDLLQFSDSKLFDKKEQIEFSEFEWLTDIDLFEGQLSGEASSAAAEVPELTTFQPNNIASYRPTKFDNAHKNARIEIPDNVDEHFIVPDLGYV